MTKIRWNKKLDTLTWLLSLSLVLVFSSFAGAQMEITYKRTGAPVAKKPKDTAPVQITYIKTAAKKKPVAKAKASKSRVIAKKAKTTRKPIRVARVAAPAPIVDQAPIDFDPSLESSAPVQTSTMVVAPELKKAPAKAWGVSTGMTYTRSMVDQKDGSMVAFMDFSAGGSYKFEAAKLSATLNASRDMKAEESTLDDFIIGVSLNPIKVFNGNMSLTPIGSIGPAVSKSDQYASLQSKTKAGLSIGLDSEKLGMGNFGLGGVIDVRKNFHEYTTSREGKINTEWASLQVVSASYGITEKLSFAFNLIHLNTWSYNGIQAEYLSHAQEISYALSKVISISGGHQMGYPFVTAWKDSGTDRNYDLVDDDESMIFATLSVSY